MDSLTALVQQGTRSVRHGVGEDAASVEEEYGRSGRQADTHVVVVVVVVVVVAARSPDKAASCRL